MHPTRRLMWRCSGLFAGMALLCLTISSGGCASSTSSVDDGIDGARTSDGALLTLESGREGPLWEGWTPARERRSVPETFSERVRAFDYWEVDDGSVVEEVWTALFPVLDSVRTRAESAARRKSLSLLLEAIEPGRRDRGPRLDLTFVVSSDGSDRFEGFACRLYRRIESKRVTPVVTVLFLRRPTGAPTPSRIAVWMAPGFEEPDRITALFERRESGWHRALLSGLELPAGELRSTSRADEAGSVAARVLTQSLWKRFAGDAYLESPQSGAESTNPPPDDIRPALGLDIRDRQIKQVYSDTTFPPRADLDEL